MTIMNLHKFTISDRSVEFTRRSNLTTLCRCEYFLEIKFFSLITE